MPTLTIEYETDTERLELERAIAYMAEMRQLGATAPSGTVLAACEGFALDAGRQMLRENLEAVVQARADVEKKGKGRGRKGDANAR